MNLYKKETIIAGVKVSRYLTDQGITVTGNRAVATWRDGTHKNVSIDDAKGLWHDFVNDEGGDVIDLCIKIEGGSFLSALRTLGDRYNIAPYKTSRKPKTATRAEMLLRDGYKLVTTYEYKDADRKPSYWVDRYERVNADGEREKTFNQRTINGEGLEGVEHILYNLPAVVAAGEVYLTEGEKDADTLNALGGFVATTPSGGSWAANMTEALRGKHVIIMADNDAKGQKIANERKDKIIRDAASVKIVTISKLDKGDVTDWMQREDGTAEKLRETVANSAPLKVPPTDFCNYTEVEVEGLDGRSGKPKKKTDSQPKLLEEIINDLDQRFHDDDGPWPRLLGGELFYVGKDADGKPKIKSLQNNEDHLTAWIGRTGHCHVYWMKGLGMHTMKTIIADLLQNRTPYVSASRYWNYPKRKDVFYMCEPPLPPSPGYMKFNDLIDRFCPADDANKTLLRAFFAAPMWYAKGCIRPFMLVDTVDAQETGKTTVLDCIELLYEENSFDFDFQKRGIDIKELKNELLGADGLGRHMAKFDNITYKLSNSGLAKIVTSRTISGRPTYARGTVDRANDLSFYVTLNGGSTDRDMARRCYRMFLKAPAPDVDRDEWLRKTRAFIETNRRQIQGDIYGLLANAKTRTRKIGTKGFPEFDAAVLSAVCETDKEFEAADAALDKAAKDGDADQQRADEFVEMFNEVIRRFENYNDDLPVRVSRAAIEIMLLPADGTKPKTTPQDILRFAQAGMLKGFSKEEFPRTDLAYKERGALYFGKILPEGMTHFQPLDYSEQGDPLTLTLSTTRIHYPNR